jgi:hypothetical protein
LVPDRFRSFAEIAAGLWTVAVCAAALALLVDRAVPPQHLPWKPLRMDDPIGRATAWKIARLEDDPVRCLALLDEAGVRTRRVPDRNDGGFCVVENAVQIEGGLTPLAPKGLVMRCPVAVGLALWDRQVLRPAARRELGADTIRIDSFGTYACRRMYHARTGPPSRHARAAAIDVSGVRLSDGRRISVVRNWRGTGPEARFLRSAHDGACEVFGTTLGPEYNAAHRDHLHLDTGPLELCR